MTSTISRLPKHLLQGSISQVLVQGSHLQGSHLQGSYRAHSLLQGSLQLRVYMDGKELPLIQLSEPLLRRLRHHQ